MRPFAGVLRERGEMERRAMQKVEPRAWAILVVTYLASFVAPMAQFKIPPLASWLIPAFHMDGTTFGYLMSALAIIGVVLAFPAAFICRRIGLKSVMLLSVAFVGIGSLIGFFAEDLAVIMISRMFEGVGIGLVGVAAPTCITIWFPESRRGLALGIWTTWVPVGLILMFNMAPPIAESFGYKAVFMVVSFISLLTFVLFALVFKVPEGKGGDITAGGTFKDGLGYLKRKEIWLLGIVFFCFCGTSLGVTNTFYNTFLEQVRGFDPSSSSFVTSLCTLVGIPLQIFTGWWFDHVKPKNRRFFIFAMCVTMGISFVIMFNTDEYANACMWGFVVLQAIGGGIAMGSLRPTAPTLVVPGALSATMSMALLQLFQNLGSAICAPLFGFAIGAIGWEASSLAIQIPLIVVAFVCAVFIIPKKPDTAGSRDADAMAERMGR